MDPEYGHRLLRQINIQNDSLSPIVSVFCLSLLKVLYNCLFSLGTNIEFDLKLNTYFYLLLFQKVSRSLHSPTSLLSSPSKLGDRFIPTRAGANWNINFHRINVRTLFLVLFCFHSCCFLQHLQECKSNVKNIVNIFMIVRKTKSPQVKTGKQRMHLLIISKV